MDLTSQKVLLGAAGAGGNPYWYLKLTGGGFNYLTSSELRVDSADNIYACLNCRETGTSRFAGVLVKISKTGALLWQKKLSQSSQDIFFHDLAIDSAGNIVVVGVRDNGGTYEHGVIVKYSSSGILLWQKNISTGVTQYYGNPCCSVVIDSSDNIYVGGGTANSNTAGYYDDWLLTKLNSSGVTQWSRSATDTANIVYISALALNSSETYLYTSGNPDNIRSFSMRVDPSTGNRLWDQQIQKVDSQNSVVKDVKLINGTLMSVGEVNTSTSSLRYPFIWWQNENGSNNGMYVFGSGNTSSTSWGSIDYLTSTSNIYLGGTIDGKTLIHITDQPYNLGTVRTLAFSTGSVQNASGRDQLGGSKLRLDSNEDMCILSSTSSAIYITKLPNAGSLLGTYGDLTYAAPSYALASTGSTNANSRGYTFTSPSRSTGNSSETDSAASLTSSSLPIS